MLVLPSSSSAHTQLFIHTFHKHLLGVYCVPGCGGGTGHSWGNLPQPHLLGPILLRQPIAPRPVLGVAAQIDAFLLIG